MQIFTTLFNISSSTAHIQRFWTQIINSAVFVEIFISQKWVFLLFWSPASEPSLLTPLWQAQHKGCWLCLTVTLEFMCMFFKIILLFNIYEAFLLSVLLFWCPSCCAVVPVHVPCFPTVNETIWPRSPRHHLLLVVVSYIPFLLQPVVD